MGERIQQANIVLLWKVGDSNIWFPWRRCNWPCNKLKHCLLKRLK